jgi:hypothetical protein
MAVTTDSTRGHERLDPQWHSRVDDEVCIDGVLALVRDYVASLAPEQLMLLPETCRAMRIKAEDDIEYWTYRISAVRPEDRCDSALVQDLFMHLLHASLRIAQIHRLRAARAGRQLRPGL